MGEPCEDCQKQAKRLAVYGAICGALIGVGAALVLTKTLMRS